MAIVRTSYKVLRSIIFSILLLVVVLFVGLYIALSIPTVQDSIRNIAQRELSNFIKAPVTIGNISIYPFNEARLDDVKISTPAGDDCIKIETLGAGINLWRLASDGQIEITYGEILGLDAKIVQEEEGGPLNIQFLIDAFAPKDKNKPPTQFDLNLHNVVIRQSSISFDRNWKPESGGKYTTFNANHLKIYDLRADLLLPRIKNDDFAIDMRRLSFKEKSGLDVRKISLKAKANTQSLSVKDFNIAIGDSKINISDFALSYDSFGDISNALKTKAHSVSIVGEHLYPKDFAAFFSPLANFEDRYRLNIDVCGNLSEIAIDQFALNSHNQDLSVSLKGGVAHLDEMSRLTGHVEKLSVHTSGHALSSICNVLPGLKDNVKGILLGAGDLDLDISGKVSNEFKNGDLKALLKSGYGDVELTANCKSFDKKRFAGDLHVTTDQFSLVSIVPNNLLGKVSVNADARLNIIGKDVEGDVDIDIPFVEYKGLNITNIAANATKSGDHVVGTIDVEDDMLDFTADADLLLTKVNPEYNLYLEIERMMPSSFVPMKRYNDYVLSGLVEADFTGNKPDNLEGTLLLNHINFYNEEEKGIRDKSLLVSLGRNNNESRCVIESDFLRGLIKGTAYPTQMVSGVKSIASAVTPTFIKAESFEVAEDTYTDFRFEISPDEEIIDFLQLPVRPLAQIDISGNIDLSNEQLKCKVTAPYLLQGTNKLIAGTQVDLYSDKISGMKLNVKTNYPMKNDAADIDLNITALDDRMEADVAWQMTENRSASGKVGFDAGVIKDEITGRPMVDLNIKRSNFKIGTATWNVEPASLTYESEKVNVNSLMIWHDNQFVKIDGTASADYMDMVNVDLASIDLKYIFDTLNINYVTFGGTATGEIGASALFTKTPIARTKKLYVKDFSYNDAILGDANLRSSWNNEEKEVEIYADIKEPNSENGAIVSGGVYVTRDSLSFDMNAKKVNIEFLKPFMSAFTSDVGGRASGNLKLFGTFHDIDLIGKAYADSICMKVDYTNVYYHGNDSVYLNPGRIEIPGFKLYDKYGNSALLTGYVKHEYFHNPEFEFKVSNAQNLLCYDTNPKINPDWYGTIFASGGGVLRGKPGIVSLMMDMTTTANSDFTFVLSDNNTALDYGFLTFSDSSKAQDTVEEEETIEDKYRKKRQDEETGKPSTFAMDLRATITPAAKLTLVMDPNAGDKITAHGSGPMQMSYDTDSDELTMYGKYTLTEGSYNFSLQELILKDFKINSGSSISFNGDPFSANLNINAAYRVNTNLSDLDKSFSTDKDLNRTNVPVDAILNVTGDLEAPEISFDISLPTLTSDVERKVKSIISTDDMMNRQIIYLLALNRFYTPEYMGSTSNGGELASVASSTISSQLSNIMGQLTDKVTVSPSFRSEKGDFSDMEVDLSLSSRLLNNRLLINGNFGYRDKNTSQTTFVGDFDLEYILSRNGDVRLKAYNHFNDQNYYLKSALTTQGVGVVYRHEFDTPFSFIRKRKGKKSTTGVAKDSVILKDENGEEDTLLNINSKK